MPECDIEKGVAKIGPLGFVPAAERRMVGIGRSDYQRIRVRETRNKDPGPRRKSGLDPEQTQPSPMQGIRVVSMTRARCGYPWGAR